MAQLIPQPLPLDPELYGVCLGSPLVMIKIPGAGISQDLQLSAGSETGLMYHFLFELTVLEEHKCSSSALSPAPSCCATFSFLGPLQGHLKVKLGNRSQDGISFAYLSSLIPIPQICSAFLTPDSIGKDTSPSLALSGRMTSIAVKHHKDYLPGGSKHKARSNDSQLSSKSTKQNLKV